MGDHTVPGDYFPGLNAGRLRPRGNSYAFNLLESRSPPQPFSHSLSNLVVGSDSEPDSGPRHPLSTTRLVRERENAPVTNRVLGYPTNPVEEIQETWGGNPPFLLLGFVTQGVTRLLLENLMSKPFSFIGGSYKIPGKGIRPTNRKKSQVSTGRFSRTTVTFL